MNEIKDNLKVVTTVTPTVLQTSAGAVLHSLAQEQAHTELGNKLRIGLFMGGASSEKEISLESARHVYNNLDREKYDVIPIFVDEKRHLWVVEESLLWKNTAADIVSALEGASHSIFYEDLKSLIDFAFIALHGKFGEEAFPGLFEILGIPNNSASVAGGALSMDKYRQRGILISESVDVPKYVGVEIGQWRKNPVDVTSKIEKHLGYPFMVKPSREGSSTALCQVRKRDEIEKAFESAFKYDNIILAEEVLAGTELTTLVYGLDEEVKALPPSELLKKGDFLTAEEKFLPGGARMITPPRLPEDAILRIKEVSIKVFKSLGLKIYSRIDSFWVEGRGVVVLEPNNPPAMTPSTALWLQAAEAGFNTTKFLDELINISLEAHAEKIGPL